MTRYIDADAYKKYLDEHWIPANYDAIDAQPTADVAPVKHGYWKANKDESGYFDVCICSECLTDFGDDLSWLVHDMELPPFCPYCGAKMDEKVKDD